MIDSTRRFSDRVENYVRYRPSYPDEVIDTLVNEAGLSQQTVIADIGSGTGISAELFLKLGCTVNGVEPNAAMRLAAEKQLCERYRAADGSSRFQCSDGKAEATTLPDDSVDVVIAAQAFHWFNVDQARQEFRRILKPRGLVALLWNSRRTDTTPFLMAYESLLLKYGTDYQQVNHRNIDPEVLQRFFAGPDARVVQGDSMGYTARTFPYVQVFDFPGVRGRLLSSSYVPPADDPRYMPMLTDLQQAFDQHQQGGSVQFEYDTELYFGPL